MISILFPSTGLNWRKQQFVLFIWQRYKFEYISTHINDEKIACLFYFLPRNLQCVFSIVSETLPKDLNPSNALNKITQIDVTQNEYEINL